MKSFFKDYGKVWKDSMIFLKDHWIGSIIFALIIWVVEVIIIFPGWFVNAWKEIQYKVYHMKIRIEKIREAKKFNKEWNRRFANAYRE